MASATVHLLHHSDPRSLPVVHSIQGYLLQASGWPQFLGKLIRGGLVRQTTGLDAVTGLKDLTESHRVFTLSRLPRPCQHVVCHLQLKLA